MHVFVDARLDALESPHNVAKLPLGFFPAAAQALERAFHLAVRFGFGEASVFQAVLARLGVHLGDDRSGHLLEATSILIDTQVERGHRLVDAVQDFRADFFLHARIDRAAGPGVELPQLVVAPGSGPGFPDEPDQIGRIGRHPDLRAVGRIAAKDGLEGGRDRAMLRRHLGQHRLPAPEVARGAGHDRGQLTAVLHRAEDAPELRERRIPPSPAAGGHSTVLANHAREVVNQREPLSPLDFWSQSVAQEQQEWRSSLERRTPELHRDRRVDQID